MLWALHFRRRSWPCRTLAARCCSSRAPCPPLVWPCSPLHAMMTHGHKRAPHKCMHAPFSALLKTCIYHAKGSAYISLQASQVSSAASRLRLRISASTILRAEAGKCRPGQDKEPGQCCAVGHGLRAQAAQPGRPLLQEVCRRVLPRPDRSRRLRAWVRMHATPRCSSKWVKWSLKMGPS